MFQSNKNVAKGVVAQLLLEEQEYHNKIFASDEYTKFTIEDDNTVMLDKLTTESKEIDTKREKLRKELAKLDERQKEISNEAVTILKGSKEDGEYFWWSEVKPQQAKDNYIRNARDAKFETHAWYPQAHTLKAIVLGQIETGNFSSFDEIVQAMRTKYQK